MEHWIASWGYRPIDRNKLFYEVENETQRVISRHNIRGNAVRLAVSNEWGDHELHFDGIWTGKPEKTRTQVTFDGKKELSLAPGEIRYSDIISMEMVPGDELYIESYVKKKTRVQTVCKVKSELMVQVRVHKGAPEEADIYPWESAADNRFYGVFRIDILTEDPVRTIAAFGDSITNHGHWSGSLARRLYDAYPGAVSMINLGISGNRVLRDASNQKNLGGAFGIAGIKRFEPDIFGPELPIDLILVLEGVNDLIHPGYDTTLDETVTAEEIIEGLTFYVETAHKHHTPILLCTILPFDRFRLKGQQEMNEKALAVNDWIRHQNVADGFLDFSEAAKDPNAPLQLAPECDSGDHLHPSAQGGETIAAAIDLDLLMNL